jgi:hypothetical protein
VFVEAEHFGLLHDHVVGVVVRHLARLADQCCVNEVVARNFFVQVFQAQQKRSVPKSEIKFTLIKFLLFWSSV